MKEAAKRTKTNPAEIYAENVKNLDPQSQARIPPEPIMKRTIRNQRKTEHPASGTSIEGEWCTTGNPDNKRLLLVDDGDEDRLVIFATDEGLQNLSKSNEWYMDGNFALSPKGFMQLYVIRVQINGIFVTAVYCLLTKKTQSTYERMLNCLMEKCAEKNIFLDPMYIHVDFEKAVINAIKIVIGEHVEVNGCFYHLTQATHRHIQKMGLTNEYKSDEEFSAFCRQLDALAFLPLCDVAEGMVYLKSIMPEKGSAILEYFDNTYVTGTFRRINSTQDNCIRLRNCPPLFPPHVWNVHNITLNDGDRTNNETEGWNHRFSKIVGHCHPSIWVLITKIRLEVANDETKLAQNAFGTLPRKKKSKIYAELQNKLKNICNEYSRGERDIPNFLKAIAYTIRYL